MQQKHGPDASFSVIAPIREAALQAGLAFADFRAT
jgi:hypothetical protein